MVCGILLTSSVVEAHATGQRLTKTFKFKFKLGSRLAFKLVLIALVLNSQAATGSDM